MLAMLYECPDCQHKATAEEWHEETRQHYRSELLMPITSPDTEYALFVCPNCHHLIHGDAIKTSRGM